MAEDFVAGSRSPVVMQFQSSEAPFAGNADVSSALSAKREMISSDDFDEEYEYFAPVGVVRTRTSALPV